MKFIKFFVVQLILLVIFTVPAYSHSGRTDSSGGHRDTKNVSGLGPYHYHHGMGPHLHPNGICPYLNSGNNSTLYSTPGGYEEGYKAGYDKGFNTGESENANESAYLFSNQAYKLGFDDGFAKGLSDRKVYREKLLKDDYDRGFLKGSNEASTNVINAPFYSKDAERQQSYAKGFYAGVEKLLKDDYNKGLLKGSSVENPSSVQVPMYSKDAWRQQSFLKGFNDGIEKRLKDDYKLGYTDGKMNYNSQCSSFSQDEKRRNSYNDGFISGQKDYYVNNYKVSLVNFNNQAFKEGYNQAFEKQVTEVPDKYKNHFVTYCMFLVE